jgi:hypothetical protein
MSLVFRDVDGSVVGKQTKIRDIDFYAWSDGLLEIEIPAGQLGMVKVDLEAADTRKLRRLLAKETWKRKRG